MDKIHSINLDVPTISVVAPVYKVEPFLQECIDSVLNQSFKDFELILVDDGSPDRCGEICDKAAEKDSRIRVFHQENEGVSSARKLGVDNAKGEWICFVDPDDRLLPNALQDLITACDTLGYNIEDFDVIEGGALHFEKNERTGKEKIDYSYGNATARKKLGIVVAGGLEYAKGRVEGNLFFRKTPWGKIIRRSLLIETDALNVPKKFFYGEDCLANFRMSKKIRKALRIQKIVYEKRMNLKGTVLSKKDKYSTFEYQTSCWNFIKETLQDMPEEWIEAYRIITVHSFFSQYFNNKGKTYKLRSEECKPYINMLKENKALLSTENRVYLFLICSPFILLPNSLLFYLLFGVKVIFAGPKRIIRKLYRMIRQR